MPGSSRDFWFACVMMGSVAMAVTGTSAQELPNPMDFGVVYEELAFEAADTDGNNLVSEGEFAAGRGGSIQRARSQPRWQTDAAGTRA